jgi:hypothetical protein
LEEKEKRSFMWKQVLSEMKAIKLTENLQEWSLGSVSGP